MNDEQNTFYTSISKHYSQIFPYNAMQLNFVENEIGELNGKQILDIGCATGELAFHLASKNAEVVGIDLNEDLLQQAVNNKTHPKLQFQKGNMLELECDFQKEQFDSILCFGNTLVHLPSKDLINKMLKGVYAVLKPGGKFLLQILNYDYILGEQVSELPLIETGSIKFIRKYAIEENSPLIQFHTELEIKEEGKTVANQTMLLALKSKDLVELLSKAGFSSVELFSNFKKDSYGGKHLPLLAVGYKH